MSALNPSLCIQLARQIYLLVKKIDKVITDLRHRALRLRLLNVRLSIIALGALSPETSQRDWVLAKAETLRNAEYLHGAKCSTIQDLPEVEKDVEALDWQISAGTLEDFLAALQE